MSATVIDLELERLARGASAARDSNGLADVLELERERERRADRAAVGVVILGALVALCILISGR